MQLELRMAAVYENHLYENCGYVARTKVDPVPPKTNYRIFVAVFILLAVSLLVSGLALVFSLLPNQFNASTNGDLSTKTVSDETSTTGMQTSTIKTEELEEVLKETRVLKQQLARTNESLLDETAELRSQLANIKSANEKMEAKLTKLESSKRNLLPLLN